MQYIQLQEVNILKLYWKIRNKRLSRLRPLLNSRLSNISNLLDCGARM